MRLFTLRQPLLCLLFWGASLAPASCVGLGEIAASPADYPDRSAQTDIQFKNGSEDPPAIFQKEPSSAQGPLKITITEAVRLCLENNRALMVQRLDPQIQKTEEDRQRAVFDPLLSAGLQAGREKAQRLARSGAATETYTKDTVTGAISLEKYFPSGTTLTLGADTEMTDSSLYTDSFYATGMAMTATQALLNGFGSGANLVRLQQARLETRMSEYELRGFAQSLVAEVEATYWDLAMARRRIDIVRQSLAVARQQHDETREMIAVGRLARAELAAVQAEVASQEQALIEAESARESFRMQLLRLLNPPGPDLFHREVILLHEPSLPRIPLEEPEVHVSASRQMQPLLNQARLEVTSGDLELVKTGNGLLPRLDFFITLGKSGYAKTFNRSLGDITAGSYEALAGVEFAYPLFNRDAEAVHRKALLSRTQAKQALENLLQLVEVDVRAAHIEVRRTRRQIDASSATRRFNEEKFRTETEKFRVGKSTSYLVAQAQRDLLSSRIGEVQALVNYLKALTALYRTDGTLLRRRGIAAPGEKPVVLFRE